jgi:SAM-dependent methyltransferase
MREFWDERAREDALFFVDDRRAYGDREPGRFWADGERDLQLLLDATHERIDRQDRVLDLGCGVGRLTRSIAKRARHVYAVDVSAEMLALAERENRQLDNVDWILGDGLTLGGLADDTVELCISHVVFQHIPDPEVTLGYVAEMGRVLVPGGRAVFGLSNNTCVHERRRGVAASVRRIEAGIGRGPKGIDQPAWLGAAVELDRLRDVASASGLRLDRIVGEGTQFCVIGAQRQHPRP